MNTRLQVMVLVVNPETTPINPETLMYLEINLDTLVTPAETVSVSGRPGLNHRKASSTPASGVKVPPPSRRPRNSQKETRQTDDGLD